MYGVFFEDINRSADGGIYAELIFNRGFEEANLPSGCTYNPGDKRVYAPHKSVYSSPEHLRSWSIPWNIEDKHPGWTVECPADGEYSVRIDDTDHTGRRSIEGHVPDHRPPCSPVQAGEQRFLRTGRRSGQKIRPAFLHQGRTRLQGRRDG
ncbi:MAG: hypothetical protein ACLRSE_00940 [Alistipes finegoldii]